ncbi:hypothetical protein BDW67DRAFT_189131 [Aspergillus spinulosporus]
MEGLPSPTQPRLLSETAQSGVAELVDREYARIARCDGTQPSCKTCEVYQDECRYEKQPPMSQIVAMAKRLQEAEQTILRLQQALEAQSPDPNGTNLESPDRASPRS